MAAANDGGAAAGAAAALPQEAAPASAKSVGKGASGDLPPLGEEIQEEFQPSKTSPKKKKGKAKETLQVEPLVKLTRSSCFLFFLLFFHEFCQLLDMNE